MKILTFEKKLSVVGATCVSVGAVVGVGIFVIVRPIGAATGGWMPLTFGIAALPAIFGTLVAVALGSTIPADGGGYYYTKHLLNRHVGAAASVMVIYGAMGAMGTVAVGVAKYLRPYYGDLPGPAIACALILVAWVVNHYGVMASERFQIFLVVQLVSALLLVIIAGLIGGASPDLSTPPPKGVGGFVGAAVLACLAYTGFNIVGELGDEIENPRRNVPLTIAFGLVIIIAIYVGVGWVVAGTIPPGALEADDTPLVTTALLVLPGWVRHYINLAALSGAITSINAVFLAVPRELSALGEDGTAPAWVLRFNPTRQTFVIGNGIVAVAGCGMMLLDQPEEVWGVVCVAGLLWANVLFSVAAFTLFRRFPREVESAPVTIKKGWLYPAAVLAGLFSVFFGGVALVQWWPNGIALGLLVVAAVTASVRASRR